MFILGYANTENVFYSLIRGDVQHKGHDCHRAPGVHIVGRAQRELRRKKQQGGRVGSEYVFYLNALLATVQTTSRSSAEAHTG